MRKLSNFFTHNNDWVLIGTTYADPQRVNMDVLQKLNPVTVEKLLFGTTTYIWQNKTTGDIKKEEHLGSDAPALRQILDRVDVNGRYDLTDGDKKYVVVRLKETPQLSIVAPTPEQSAPSNLDVSRLPVRAS